MGVIVVGVDYSEGAKAALRFALAEATLRHATWTNTPLLGSVSQQCAQHAACPVVIIPHRRAS
jgi:nucleotide-binding universal stress UspA family protein